MKKISPLNVFSADQMSVKPEAPLKPFICDESIVLSENELKILARGPNFMIREELDEENFSIELEKAIAKVKFNSRFKEDDCSEKETVQSPAGLQLHASNQLNSEVTSNSSLNVKDQLWEENSGRMVYNLKTKSLDFGNMRACSYKYNREICMPDADSPDVETLHQSRRN